MKARCAMTDEALVALLKAVACGDRRAFRSVYDFASPRLFAAALRLLRARDLAEDATQDAFLKIWRHAKCYDADKGAPMAWMGAIARRCAISRIGVERPTVPVDGADLTVDPVEASSPRLIRALENLPATHRQALLLSYTYGMSHSELAEHLGVPLGTAKSWVLRAMTALREHLKP
jgi:RNA polymerase sigma-70 factor (ECF subfamily)